jgi:hypothetical protein
MEAQAKELGHKCAEPRDHPLVEISSQRFFVAQETGRIASEKEKRTSF